jgi:uracil-DNA glycosylase
MPKMCWRRAPSHRLTRVAERFEDVVSAARACTACVGLPLGPKPIFQIGKSARILIVGQAPGRLTHAKGLPFDDASGERLRNWMGIGRDVFYDASKIACLPMGFCYPGKGKGGDLPPRVECAPLWRQRLLSLLHHIKLTLVIGQYAHSWHFPDDNRALTDRVRGWNGGVVVPLPHPSPRNGVWLKANPWFEAQVLPKLRKRVQEALNDT